MKKIYFILLPLFCSITAFAQNTTFNNGGADLLWSNPANWSLNALPGPSNNVLSSFTGTQVDQDFTIKGIQNQFGTANNISFGGAGVLTLDPGINNGVAIKNVSDSDVTLSFAGNVTINNTGGAQTWMRNENGNTNDLNDIEFEDGSVLTLLTNLEARSSSGGDIFNFNGSLTGTAALRIGANTTCIFGSTSDNSGFDGDFVFVGANGAIVVNTADNTTFLPSSRKFQVNQDNVSVEINGANVIQGNFVVGGTNILTVDFNKDQGSMSTIGIPAGGTLNLDVDASVANLSFANSSEVSWGTGTLNITNFTEGVLRFGNDNTGLTAGQLSQITVDGGGGPVALDSDGYLVNESSLSVDEFKDDSFGYIAYPTLADSKLYFKKPQDNVKVFDLTGKIIIQNQSQSQTEIGVSSLNKGIYLIVFDNKIAEKFIKQ